MRLRPRRQEGGHGPDHHPSSDRRTLGEMDDEEQIHEIGTVVETWPKREEPPTELPRALA